METKQILKLYILEFRKAYLRGRCNLCLDDAHEYVKKKVYSLMNKKDGRNK